MSLPERPPNTWAIIPRVSSERSLNNLIRAGIPAAPSNVTGMEGNTLSGIMFPYPQLGEALRALGVSEEGVLVLDTLNPDVVVIRIRTDEEGEERTDTPTPPDYWDLTRSEEDDPDEDDPERDEPTPFPSAREIAYGNFTRPDYMTEYDWEYGQKIAESIIESPLLVGGMRPQRNMNIDLTQTSLPSLELFDSAVCDDLDEIAMQATQMLEKYAEVLHRKIRIWNTHTGEVPDKIRHLTMRGHPEILPILFWTSPVHCTGIGSEMPNTLISSCFGFPVANSQRDNVGITVGDPDTFPIVDPTTGDTVAQIRRGVLFIRFDLPHQQDYNTLGILEAILDAAVPILGGQPEDLMGQRVEEVLIRRIDSLRSIKVVQCQRNVDSAEEMIRENHRTIARVVRQLQAARLELDMWSSPDGVTTAEKAKKEAAALRSLADVYQVRASAAGLSITTKHINFFTCRRWRLGHKYNIRIPLSGSGSGAVLITAADRIENPGTPLCHPHVNMDSTPCWGNIGTGVANYISRFELAAAVDLIIRYLKSANTTDWYADPYLWPEVTGEYSLEVVPGTGCDNSAQAQRRREADEAADRRRSRDPEEGEEGGDEDDD